MPLLNASTGGQRYFGKKVLRVVRMTISPKFCTHTDRGQQCIISDPVDFLYPPKLGSPLTVPFASKKSHAVNNSPIGLVVPNFYMVGRNLMAYHIISSPETVPAVGSATPNMPSVENSLFENFVTLVSWCYMIISWCVLKSGAKWVFGQHNMARDYLYIF